MGENCNNVENNHDVPVVVTLGGNRGIYTTTVELDSFIVPSLLVEARTLSIDNDGWLPRLTIDVAAVNATSGNFSVYVIERN